MEALVARSIRKTFREGRETFEVLRGVDISLRHGEVVALEGPSGSGKSTLLSILGCILTPTSGDLEVAQQPVRTGRPHELAAVRRDFLGFVFQHYNLVPALTAFENVELSLHLRGHDRRDAAERARRSLDAVGLGDRMRFLPRDLSGGQRQRVAIARAVAGRATVVLADEPTANLDRETGEEILSLFRRLASAEQRALLIVTHDPRVRRICDRVLTIADGRVSAAAAS